MSIPLTPPFKTLFFKLKKNLNKLMCCWNITTSTSLHWRVSEYNLDLDCHFMTSTQCDEGFEDLLLIDWFSLPLSYPLLQFCYGGQSAATETARK